MGSGRRNGSVKNTKDMVKFGPYADGGAAGGSICTTKMNGQPLSDVKHIAYIARYTATGDTGGIGVPYLRIFTQSDNHDAIFSPNTQPPDPDIEEGPFHTWAGDGGRVALRRRCRLGWSVRPERRSPRNRQKRSR